MDLFYGCRSAAHPAGCYLPGCCFYSGDQRMCDRTFHSCYGSPVEPHWKSGYPVPDTDRRDRTDRTGEYDIHQLRRKISLKNRRIIKESYNLDEMGGVVVVVRSVVKCVFLAEGIGAVLYAFCFVPEFGIKKGLVHAIFLAVSAFCNAGIDLFGETSLSVYVSNPLVNITTIGLIIVSGLGFIVWWDLWDKFSKVLRKELSPSRVFRVLRLQSKLVLTMTGILVFSGAFLVFIFESGNPSTLKGAPLEQSSWHPFSSQ